MSSRPAELQREGDPVSVAMTGETSCRQNEKLAGLARILPWYSSKYNPPLGSENFLLSSFGRGLGGGETENETQVLPELHHTPC